MSDPLIRFVCAKPRDDRPVEEFDAFQIRLEAVFGPVSPGSIRPGELRKGSRLWRLKHAPWELGPSIGTRCGECVHFERDPLNPTAGHGLCRNGRIAQYPGNEHMRWDEVRRPWRDESGKRTDHPLWIKTTLKELCDGFQGKRDMIGDIEGMQVRFDVEMIPTTDHA